MRVYPMEGLDLARENELVGAMECGGVMLASDAKHGKAAAGMQELCVEFYDVARERMSMVERDLSVAVDRYLRVAVAVLCRVECRLTEHTVCCVADMRNAVGTCRQFVAEVRAAIPKAYVATTVFALLERQVHMHVRRTLMSIALNASDSLWSKWQSWTHTSLMDVVHACENALDDALDDVFAKSNDVLLARNMLQRGTFESLA